MRESAYDWFTFPAVAEIAGWVAAQPWNTIVGIAGSTRDGLLATYIKRHSRAGFVYVNPWLGERSYAEVDDFSEPLPIDLRNMEQRFDQLQSISATGISAKRARTLFA